MQINIARPVIEGTHGFETLRPGMIFDFSSSSTEVWLGGKPSEKDKKSQFTNMGGLVFRINAIEKIKTEICLSRVDLDILKEVQ